MSAISTSQSVLQVENISYRYRRTQALNNCSFNLGMGGCLGVLGPNGSGKTTLLTLLARQRRMQEGRVFLSGSGTYEALRIGWASSEGPLYEKAGFRGFVENTFGPAVGLSKAEASLRCHELAGHLGFEADCVKAPKNMSRGMRVKASIILAFLEKPELVVLDEPFVGLDVQSVDSMLKLVRAARDNGTTIIIADHQVGSLEGILDHVAFITGGAIVESSPAADLKAHHGSILGGYRAVFGITEV